MSYVNSSLCVIIVIFWLFNSVSLYFLNHCYENKKMGSFQEMAWSSSQGNRGYIFLISAMKIAYLSVTSAYCISFIACYLTSLVQCTCHNYFSPLDHPKNTPSPWISYGIYVAFVLLVSSVAFFITKDTEPEKIREKKTAPLIFFISSVLSFVLMVTGLIIIALSNKTQKWMVGTGDFSDDRSIYFSQLYYQGINYDPKGTFN